LSNTPAFVRNQDRAVLAREEPDDATVLNAVLFMVVWSGTNGGQRPQPLHDMALLWSNLAGRLPSWAEDL
jgi:hypothetical protein